MRNGDVDIPWLIAEGYEVDDDNEPNVENIPDAGPPPLIEWSEWGWQGVDLRNENDQQRNHGARVPTSEFLQEFSLFWKFFPKKYIEQVVIPETNKQLTKPVTIGEFTRWLGLIFLMGTVTGCERRDFWSIDEISAFEGAPHRFSSFMTCTRFEEILSSLRLTDIPFPPYTDRFHVIRQMINEWNKNIQFNFVPSWINCLDESICVWTSKYTCPGWMVVPRKPHPFGNEYHTLCCGKTGIMYHVEIVEGKDRPPEKGPKQYDEKGKTVGLVLRMTRSIQGTYKCVIMDSGFAVLDALIELKKVGVLGSMVVKKKRYWPKGVAGDEINAHMATKEVGETDARKGVKDGKSFYVFAMKEPEYTMILLSTFGALTEVDVGGNTSRNYKDPITGNATRKNFKYTQPYNNHYKFRHQVDDHNAKRHAPISIEDALGVRKWSTRQIIFLLALTEVNVKLG